jgi:predicted carbohydrate-binding protein with CBM5 and CBM33 domain
MTRSGWYANAPLTRPQFNSTPFCSVSGNGSRPPMSGVTRTCTLPDRTGYHFILAVRTINDTANAFYNAIDVELGGSSTPPPPRLLEAAEPVATARAATASAPTVSAAPNTDGAEP